MLRHTAICGLLALLSVPAQGADLKVGDMAPDFTMPGSDGTTYQLSDFRGEKAVVLAWFPKAFTGGCTKECQALRKQGDAVREFDVAYFTASTDTPEQNKKFAESLGLDYPILSDPAKDTAEAYGVVHGVRQVPERWTFYIGADGKILHIDKQVNVTTAGTDIAKKLAELGVEKK